VTEQINKLSLAREITRDEVRVGDWITLVSVVKVGKSVVTNRTLCRVASVNFVGGILTISGLMNSGGLSRDYKPDTVSISDASQVHIKLLARDGVVLGF
jgi:hypothetical protein